MVSSTAAFKYRYKTPQGHMEDSHPVLNSSTHKVRNQFTTVGDSADRPGQQPQHQVEHHQLSVVAVPVRS